MGQKVSKNNNYSYMVLCFLANGAEMVTQETIIYRLVMKNPSFVPYLPFSIFRALLGLKRAWPHLAD